MLLEILKSGEKQEIKHIIDRIIQDIFTLQMVTKSKHAMQCIITVIKCDMLEQNRDNCWNQHPKND